ncbi:TPA: SA1788 family PVL leukocidin-associated protein [Staphylococcus aureus]
MAGIKTKVRIDGKLMTLIDASEKYDIKVSTLITRHTKGLRGQELIQNLSKAKKVEINGKMMTVNEIANKYNISKGLLNYRIGKGLTGNALIAPPQEKKTFRDDGRITKEERRILSELDARHEQEMRVKRKAEKNEKERQRLAMIEKHKRRDPYWFDVTYDQTFAKWQEA